jgi:hypothetical protein
LTTKIRTWPVRKIPLKKIHPNEWNPNRLSVGLQRKLQRGVEDQKLGVLVDLLVRPCKKHRGRDFEIVDGEHRWEIYKSIGIDVIEAKVADLGDDDAKMAGTILNELRGTLEIDRFQELAAGLASTVGVERMAELMPWREGRPPPPRRRGRPVRRAGGSRRRSEAVREGSHLEGRGACRCLRRLDGRLDDRGPRPGSRRLPVHLSAVQRREAVSDLRRPDQGMGRVL